MCDRPSVQSAGSAARGRDLLRVAGGGGGSGQHTVLVIGQECGQLQGILSGHQGACPAQAGDADEQHRMVAMGMAMPGGVGFDEGGLPGRVGRILRDLRTRLAQLLHRLADLVGGERA